MTSRRWSALTASLAMFVAGSLLAGCGLQIPTDPDGTLEEIRTSGELRVGVSPHPPFTTLPEEPDALPGGTEVELVTGFAETVGAEPVWVVDGEESLVKDLEEGEIHLLVGGLTAKSPWAKHVALTRPYATTPEDGKQVDHVMAVVPGENALLSELERYLDGETP